MIEKNRRKMEAKRYRVSFQGKLGILVHESAKHPNRDRIKKETRRFLMEK